MAQEQPAFVPAFSNQRNLPLAQIPHAAVDQLGAATGGSFGKIILFQKEGFVLAGCSVHGCAEARRSAADDDDIPKKASILDLLAILTPIHGHEKLDARARLEGVIRSRALLSGSGSIVTMDASAETQRRFEGVEAAERINEELMRRRRQEWERTYRLRQEGRQQ